MTEEQIIVLPDLYKETNEMMLVDGNFTEYIQNKGFGWNGTLATLLRVVNRTPAEEVPEAGGDKIRQLIANTMVFELPIDVMAEIGRAKQDIVVPETLAPLLEKIKENASLLCAVRLKGSGEKRLHNKLSCAYGGHVDASDFYLTTDVLNNTQDEEMKTKRLNNFLDILLQIACMRELEEELKLGSDTETNQGLWKNTIHTSIVPFGIINSSESEVESVHMGAINVLAVPDRFQLQVNETDKLEMKKFLLKDLANEELFQDYKLETWTKISFQEQLIDKYAMAILRSI